VKKNSAWVYVAVDWHELLTLQHIMRLSTAPASEQLNKNIISLRSSNLQFSIRHYKFPTEFLPTVAHF